MIWLIVGCDYIIASSACLTLENQYKSTVFNRFYQCWYQIKEAISCGICKINFNTELQQAWTIGVRNKLNDDVNVYDPRKIILSGEERLKQVIDEKAVLLGTTPVLDSDI